LIDKIKKALAKIGAFFVLVWNNFIVEGARKIGKAIRGLVMIDGDVYFTSNKKDGSPRVFSLYFGLVGSILVGAFLATLIFMTTRAATDYYINNVYLSEENKKAREEDYLEDLRQYILENNITAADSDKFQAWIDENRYVFLSVSSGNELIYSSIVSKPEQPPEDGEDKLPEDGSVVDPENPGLEKPETPDDNIGGILSGPTREEILDKVGNIIDSDPINIEYEDGKKETFLVKIYDYSEYFQRDILNVLCFVVSMIVLATVIVEHFGRIIVRINRLQYDVKEVAEGHLEYPIVATGFDEITRLAYDVENMRTSMLENIEKEREALQMNTELITSMSHDIRTPLTVLMGYVDIMKSDLPPEEMREYVLASEKTVHRLKQLSDDMFKYFRAFGKGAEGITMEEYDAATLFEQLLTEHVLLLSESGYDVKYDISELLEGNYIVRTDAPHMTRIIDNIFSNLYKYADMEREVYITGKKVDDTAVFEFKNTTKVNSGAESSKVGLKTCKRLSEYILNSFDYGDEDGTFTLTFSMKLHEEGTKISESFYIR
jgi:signal transduction histidine kinase